MPVFRTTEGSVIVCTREKPKRCHCGNAASRLCDAKTGPRSTCSAPLCPRCTYSPAQGVDLCPTHREATR